MTMASGPATVREIRRAQRADGPAAILAIGTANPPTCMSQDEYPDYYFRVTNSEHLTELKDKLTRICKQPQPSPCMQLSRLKPPQEIGHQEAIHAPQRGAPILAAHPDFADHALPSLDARVDLASAAVPELAARAASRAIAEWGRPATDTTHLVFSTYSGFRAPSADLRLASLLGLRATVSRTVLSLSGCSGGGRALHLAKEIAENNRVQI
ncbi:hypothetical protein EJB05_12429, partial [Eragrostis curvula]